LLLKVMQTRDDHVIVVNYPDTTTVVEHADGTRITTVMQDVSTIANTADETAETGSSHTHTHTHTHNHFTALWTLSGTTRVSWYRKVYFAIFWIFWCKMKITQADTNNPDGLPPHPH